MNFVIYEVCWHFLVFKKAWRTIDFQRNMPDILVNTWCIVVLRMFIQNFGAIFDMKRKYFGTSPAYQFSFLGNGWRIERASDFFPTQGSSFIATSLTSLRLHTSQFSMKKNKKGRFYPEILSRARELNKKPIQLFVRHRRNSAKFSFFLTFNFKRILKKENFQNDSFALQKEKS